MAKKLIFNSIEELDNQARGENGVIITSEADLKR